LKGARKLNKLILVSIACLIFLVGCSNEKVTKTPKKEPVITLTSEEREIYNKFSLDLKEEHLKNLSPLSIAKLYINAGLERKYEVEYALYTDRKNYVRWSKEDHMKFPDSDRLNKSIAETIYRGIEQATFKQKNDFEGTLIYNNKGFQLIKDEDGIWNVGFMPIQ
jgi:hypothetical protein